MQRLSFENNQFVLQTGNESKTIDLKAAAANRRIADRVAEKVLDRALVKFYAPPTRPLPPFLDSHQEDGVEWVLTRSRSYLAHAPGAGKTVEAIVAAFFTARVPGEYDVFIVPPGLTKNWEREIIQWTRKLLWSVLPVIIDRKMKAAELDEILLIGKRRVFIVADTMLTRPWVLKALHRIKKAFVSVDEASRFKSAGAMRTRALFGGKVSKGLNSAGLVQSARHAVLLDGSPMLKRPMELWAPVYAMAPETIDFMSEQDFGFKYCGGRTNDRGEWEFKGASNQEELKARLQKDFMHVVTEDKLNHPERMRSMLYMDSDVRTRTMKTWEEKNLARINFKDLDENMSQGDIAHHRRELGMRKIKWVVERVRSRLENSDESILVFAWHRDVCYQIWAELKEYPTGLILGGTGEALRERYLKNFNEGYSRLLVMNIAAGGRGHNIQKADRVIFAEWGWSNEVNRQCEKRASRRGRDQNLPVRCEYIVAPNSMDEITLKSVFTAAKNVKRIIG